MFKSNNSRRHQVASDLILILDIEDVFCTEKRIQALQLVA